MGLRHTEFFDNTSYESSSTQIIVCDECLAHLCLSSLVLSDNFSGLSGDALLVDKLINISTDNRDLKTEMKTGLYLVNKIHCSQCLTELGWMYKKLFKYLEVYKEGKFVIEKSFIKEIPNNSSSSVLIQQARLLRRRRSLASATSLLDEGRPSVDLLRWRDLDDFHSNLFVGLPAKFRHKAVYDFHLEQRLRDRDLEEVLENE